MTTNPLALRRSNGGDRPFHGPTYGTQEWCDWRNQTMARNDIEWVLDGHGACYLRDIPAFTQHHTKALARSAEQERRKWIWRHNNPEKVIGEA